MPYFKEGRSTRKVKLPSAPEYEVEIFTDIKWGQTKHSLTLLEDGSVDMVMSADKLLSMLIVSWNLDDEKGEVLPITPENIDRLEPADALFIAKEAGADEAVAAESKKNSRKS